MTTTSLATKRIARAAWRSGRKVRILSDAFGYGGKIGTIRGMGAERVFVEVKLGKKPADWDEVAYLPEHLRLI